jgi:lipoprotein-anchoring transpeptidase ErfK/SrfK
MFGRDRSAAACNLCETSCRHFALSLVVGLIAAGLSGQSAAARSHGHAAHARTTQPAVALTADSIEHAQLSPDQHQGKRSEAKQDPLVFKAEVLLDRAGFSPGEIDAHDGENFQKALRAYQQANELPPTGKLDQETWDSLTKASDQAVTRDYTITADDENGPFVDKIPTQFDQMAKLKQLGYRSPAQRIAEEFHMSEDALTTLNKNADFKKDGTQLIVANVPEMALDGGLAAKGKRDTQSSRDAGPIAARIEVDKAERAVRVFDRDGKLLAYYPASIGSTEKPAPSGKFIVKRVEVDPTYHYNPKYAFKGQTAKTPVTVPPGPKNPVGLVWIDLSAASYGIHGTPAPQNISKTQSHGCIRLTNWDALALAKLVKKGTPVDFVE